MAKKTIFDPVYKNMIAELKQIRSDCHINQRDLAQKMGVPHCYVGRMETCERRLDIIELIRVLRALNQSYEQIIDFITEIVKQSAKNG